MDASLNAFSGRSSVVPSAFKTQGLKGGLILKGLWSKPINNPVHTNILKVLTKHKAIISLNNILDLKKNSIEQNNYGSYVRYQQFVNEIPVIDSYLVVALDNENRIKSLTSAVSELNPNINPDQAISKEEAEDSVKNYIFNELTKHSSINLPYTMPYNYRSSIIVKNAKKENNHKDDLGNKLTWESVNENSLKISKPKFIYRPFGNNAKLLYVFYTFVPTGDLALKIHVDAESGQVVLVRPATIN